MKIELLVMLIWVMMIDGDSVKDIEMWKTGLGLRAAEKCFQLVTDFVIISAGEAFSKSLLRTGRRMRDEVLIWGCCTECKIWCNAFRLNGWNRQLQWASLVVNCCEMTMSVIQQFLKVSDDARSVTLSRLEDEYRDRVHGGNHTSVALCHVFEMFAEQGIDFMHGIEANVRRDGMQPRHCRVIFERHVVGLNTRMLEAQD